MTYLNWQKHLKQLNDKEYGEFPCPFCNEIFHQKKQLIGHYGGKHKRNSAVEGIPTCKMCGKKLIENKNWAQWAIKQRNLICVPCKRIQNKISYRNRMKKGKR